MKKLALTVLLLSATWAATAAQQEKEVGLVNGVVESTDQDRIAAIEAHAQQLEAKQTDQYEPPAAGKRHKHARRHGAKHMRGTQPSGSDAPTRPEAQ